MGPALFSCIAARGWASSRFGLHRSGSSYPGRPEDLIVRTDSEILARWHLRHITYEEAARVGRMQAEACLGREVVR